MRGKRRAFMAEVDREIALAWRIENFARAGKGFKDLDHYLAKTAEKPRGRQTPAEMIAALRGVASLAGRQAGKNR